MTMKIGWRALLLTTVFVRVVSQVVWELSSTIGLDIGEFFYGMIVATHVWFPLEIAKLLTSAFTAFLVLNFNELVKSNAGLSAAAATVLYFSLTIMFSYPHARLWVYTDCQIEPATKEITKKCLQRNFGNWL